MSFKTPKNFSKGREQLIAEEDPLHICTSCGHREIDHGENPNFVPLSARCYYYGCSCRQFIKPETLADSEWIADV